MKTTTLLLAGLLVSSLPTIAHSNKIEQALNHSDRPLEDKSRDQNRKPSQIVKLLDIQPNMKVIDYIAGGGYYSEIFARVLNNSGKLYSVKGRLSKRDLKNYSNISVTKELNLSDINEPVDRIFTALNYHDAVNNKKLDRSQLLNSIYNKLNKDGYLIVIDHNAAPGSGISQTKKKHRIENTFVLNEIQAAGFVLDRSLSVLANPNDNFDLDVWQKSTKGKTDRFVYRFKKVL
ncbi:class I SAM-dependent methyltransferase [Pseudoalteromonas denitrificans]|jgi:predicted methyltransferase|uniref:Predicted methyltransferase n=1 Tax=Pseudoalteromonas denitrificans DSM 6059 TaxID=1123010 RepID=A0A1I1I6B3_9GAMM|nr:class I SAM-dependent methyltransferase [Pseudoalteromonas denitrificans]SFC31641.1 Predicted methyltransferase [Pseudoalteromonas denitrificans DSM 6059]